MEVERRTYEEFERYEDGFDDFLMKYVDDDDEGKEDGFDEFLRKYAYDNDELSNAESSDYDNELKILKNLFQKINLSTKNRELHALNYIEIMNKFKDVVIDVSDACTIQVDALELISQLKDHFAYYNLTGFFVDCHLKYNLENFDDPIKYNYDERVCGGVGAVDDVESHAELAREAIDKYNHHNGAKLKLVRMIKMNVMFTFLIRYYITFSAIDEDTGCIATYQAALAVRYPVSILGFLRDVDANKFLSILSIKGAEEEANYNLNFRASILAEHQLNAESSRCNSVSSASHDIHAGVVEEMKYNLIDGAPSSPNNLILVE